MFKLYQTLGMERALGRQGGRNIYFSECNLNIIHTDSTAWTERKQHRSITSSHRQSYDDKKALLAFFVLKKRKWALDDILVVEYNPKNGVVEVSNSFFQRRLWRWTFDAWMNWPWLVAFFPGCVTQRSFYRTYCPLNLAGSLGLPAWCYCEDTRGQQEFGDRNKMAKQQNMTHSSCGLGWWTLVLCVTSSCRFWSLLIYILLELTDVWWQW